MTTLRRYAAIIGLLQYTVFALAFVRLAVVSRLLTVEEVGAFILASSLFVIAGVVRNFGMLEYLVAVDEVTADLKRTCFSILIAAGLFFFCVSFWAAPSAATFFGAEALAVLIPIMGLTFLVFPIGLLPSAMMRRRMEFERIGIVRFVGALVDTVVSIGLVVWGFGVVSLAISYFVALLASMVTIALLDPRDMVVRPGVRGLRPALRFGALTSAGSLMNSFGDFGPALILGRATDSTSVGYFGRGQSLVRLLRQGVETAMEIVLQPWFAQIKRSEPEQSAERFSQLLSGVFIFTFPAYVFLFIEADVLIPLLLGPQWEPSISLARALAVGGLFSPIAVYGATLMVGQGRVGRRMWCSAVCQTGRLAILLALISGSTLAFSAGVSAAHALAAAITVAFLRKDIGLKLSQVFSPMGWGCLLGVIVGVSVAGTRALVGWEETATWTWMLGLAGLAAVLWITTILMSAHPASSILKSLIARTVGAQK